MLTAALAAQGVPSLVANVTTTPVAGVLADTQGVLVGPYSIAFRLQPEFEVWRTDGTAAGTTLLRALPGTPPFRFEPVTRGGLVFFPGPLVGEQSTLWVSDGTSAGTVPIGGSGLHPADLAVDTTMATTRIWFSATDAVNGRELWRSDGTAAGTVRVTQVASGSADGVAYRPTRTLAVLPSGVFFAGQNGTSGTELFRLVGGTIVALFANLASGSASSDPREFVASGDHLMFMATGSLGSEAYCVAQGVLQTIDVVPGATGSAAWSPVVYQSSVGQPFFYFSAATPTHGTEVWRYNPLTQALTAIDIVPGTASSYALPKFQLGTRVVCLSNNQLFGPPSFACTISGGGTTVTTVLNGATDVGLAATSPATMLLAGNGMWRSDGTPAGTLSFDPVSGDVERGTLLPVGAGYLLRDGRRLPLTGAPTPTPLPMPGPPLDAGSGIGATVAMPGGTVLFAAQAQSNRIFRSNGTTTEPLVPTPGDVQLFGSFSPLLSGRRWFLSLGPTPGLYSTDGTVAGTQLELATFSFTFAVPTWTVLGGNLLMFYADQVRVISTTGVQMVSFTPPEATANPGPVVLGNVAYYAGGFAAGASLWRTDGTQTGTYLLRDIHPGAQDGVFGNKVVLNPTTVLFVGDNGTARQVWRTGGSFANTVAVSSIAFVADTDPELFAATGTGRALFAANSLLGRDMWTTDGTNAGTSILLYDVGNTVTFLGSCRGRWLYTEGDTNGTRLHATDGTAPGTTLVATLPTGSVGTATRLDGFSPATTAVLLFRVGDRLYRSDGTAAGTFGLGPQPMSGTAFAPPGAATALFAAYDLAGEELWRTDGTVAGTVPHADLYAGAGSSHPGGFCDAGGTLYFRADDGLRGSELWSLVAMPTVLPYGLGCPGTGGLVPTITVTAPARLGSSLQIELAAALPNSFALHSLGLQGLELPIGGGCSALTVSLVNNTLLTGPAGVVGTQTAIPNSLAIVGVSVYSQFAVLDAAGAFGNLLSLSAAVAARVGH